MIYQTQSLIIMIYTNTIPNNKNLFIHTIFSTVSSAAPQILLRVSTEFRRHGIPRNFLTSEVISAQFRRNSAKFRGIPRNFAGIAPEITSVFRGMPKCHFRGHPNSTVATDAGIEPRTVASGALAVRHSNH